MALEVQWWKGVWEDGDTSKFCDRYTFLGKQYEA